LTSLKLFKLTFQSYVKKMKKVNFYKKISLFHHAGNYFSSNLRKLHSYCDSVKELKLHNRRSGRWWNIFSH